MNTTGSASETPDGLRRSAFEAGGPLTTFLWDGDDYPMANT